MSRGMVSYPKAHFHDLKDGLVVLAVGYRNRFSAKVDSFTIDEKMSLGMAVITHTHRGKIVQKDIEVIYDGPSDTWFNDKYEWPNKASYKKGFVLCIPDYSHLKEARNRYQQDSSRATLISENKLRVGRIYRVALKKMDELRTELKAWGEIAYICEHQVKPYDRATYKSVIERKHKDNV